MIVKNTGCPGSHEISVPPCQARIWGAPKSVGCRWYLMHLMLDDWLCVKPVCQLFVPVSAMGVVCHCNICQDVLDTTNTTCQLKEGSKCYAAIQVYEDNTEEIHYGCLPPEEMSHMQVWGCSSAATCWHRGHHSCWQGNADTYNSSTCFSVHQITPSLG